MRKGFDGLYGMVSMHLEHEPLSGDMYLFVARNRKRAKVLMWDGTGLCLYAKRLVGKVAVSPGKLCLKCLTNNEFIEKIQYVEAGENIRRQDPPAGRLPP